MNHDCVFGEIFGFFDFMLLGPYLGSDSVDQITVKPDAVQFGIDFSRNDNGRVNDIAE